MTKSITTKSRLGKTVTVTFEDDYEYVRWSNNIVVERKLDKLPKTDPAYKVLNDFKGALSVMAMSSNNNKNCVIYTRNSARCTNWSVSFCRLD